MATVPSSRTSLGALEALVAVAEHGSVSAAARTLGVTQPSMSGALRRLEARVGAALVERGPRGTVVTAEGARLAALAADVLHASDAFEAAAAQVRTGHRDRVVVAASMTVAEHLVPRWLAAQGPSAAAVDLAVRNSADVQRAVLGGEAELGFVETPDVDARLAHRAVGTDELAVVVAPTHPWARRRTPVRPNELAAAPLALREVGSGTRVTLERALARAGQPVVQPAHQLGSSTALVQVVRAGRHVGVLSRFAVDDDLARGTLVEVATTGVDLHRTLTMVWARGRRPAPAAQDFARVALAAAAVTGPVPWNAPPA